jgi:hypothetical protein
MLGAGKCIAPGSGVGMAGSPSGPVAGVSTVNFGAAGGDDAGVGADPRAAVLVVWSGVQFTADVVGLVSSFAGNIRRTAPMPAARLNTADAPMVSCFRESRASNPATVFGGADGAGVSGAVAVAGLGAGVIAAPGFSASALGGESTRGADAALGTGTGEDRGNAGLPGTSTAMGSVIPDLVVSWGNRRLDFLFPQCDSRRHP